MDIFDFLNKKPLSIFMLDPYLSLLKVFCGLFWDVASNYAIFAGISSGRGIKTQILEMNTFWVAKNFIFQSLNNVCI